MNVDERGRNIMCLRTLPSLLVYLNVVFFGRFLLISRRKDRKSLGLAEIDDQPWSANFWKKLNFRQSLNNFSFLECFLCYFQRFRSLKAYIFGLLAKTLTFVSLSDQFQKKTTRYKNGVVNLYCVWRDRGQTKLATEILLSESINRI